MGDLTWEPLLQQKQATQVAVAASGLLGFSHISSSHRAVTFSYVCDFWSILIHL